MLPARFGMIQTEESPPGGSRVPSSQRRRAISVASRRSVFLLSRRRFRFTGSTTTNVQPGLEAILTSLYLPDQWWGARPVRDGAGRPTTKTPNQRLLTPYHYLGYDIDRIGSPDRLAAERLAGQGGIGEPIAVQGLGIEMEDQVQEAVIVDILRRSLSGTVPL